MTDEQSLSLVRRIAARPEELYRAWTDPQQMAKWLAPAPYRVTSVEAELRVGGAYRIAVAHGEEEHVTVGQYVELVPNQRIVKTWQYRGPHTHFGAGASLVTIELRPIRAKLTELILTHSQLANARAAKDTRDGWLSCFDLLEEVQAPEHRFRTTRTVKASLADAYAAWTDPGLMRKWFGTVVEAEVRVGGHYRVENHEPDGNVFKHKGEYLVLEPERRIVKTFVFDGEGFPDYASEYSDETITITFRALGPRSTEVTLTNSWNGKGMSPDELENLGKGWADWLGRFERALTAS